MKEVVKLSELLKDAYLYYQNANPQEKETVIKQIFSELTINGNTLKYKCKNGFQALESRFVASGDPTTWLSELVNFSGSIQISMQNLQYLMRNNIPDLDPPD